MPYVSYDHTSLYSSSAQVAVHYHVRQALLGSRDNEQDSNREIIDACLDGPLSGALSAIREWSLVWAPQVAPGFDRTKGPEIALNLNITSKGNLEVTWTPIMTQKQFDSAPSGFMHWIKGLDYRPIARQRDSQLYFIRGVEDLHWRLTKNRDVSGTIELSHISAVALAVLMAELPRRLAHMVQAHWQDMLDFEFRDTSGQTPVASGIAIYGIWQHSQAQAEERMKRCLSEIGVDANRLDEEWSKVETTNPRVRSDTGRSKAVAATLGVRPDQVEAARSAIEAMSQWQGEEPHLWWNRTNPYPRNWGGHY